MRLTIKELESKIVTTEIHAKRQLTILEVAMVNCGYTRNGSTSTVQARRGRGRRVFWTDGKLYVARGVDKKTASVAEMKTHELLHVARSLPALLDSLEEGSRWMLRELHRAIETVEGVMRDLDNSEARTLREDADQP